MLCMVVVLILNIDYKVPIIRHRFASKIPLFSEVGPLFFLAVSL